MSEPPERQSSMVRVAADARWIKSSEPLDSRVKTEHFGACASAPTARNETWQSRIAVRSADVSLAGAKSRRFSRKDQAVRRS